MDELYPGGDGGQVVRPFIRNVKTCSNIIFNVIQVIFFHLFRLIGVNLGNSSCKFYLLHERAREIITRFIFTKFLSNFKIKFHMKLWKEIKNEI